MTDYIFKSTDETVEVLFRTDRIGQASKFNVLDIQGRSEAEEILGLNFERLDYDHSTFVDFANANNLTLVTIENGNKAPQATQALSIVEDALNNATELAAFEQQLTIVGGVPPYTVIDNPADNAKDLVASLSVDNKGLITGTVDDLTAEVDRAVEFRVIDSVGTTLFKEVTHTIVAN